MVDCVKECFIAPSGQAEDEWERPVPLESAAPPPFPVETLPDWLGRFTSEVARATETPVELPALMALATVSTCVARAFQVEVKPGYREPLNIWACVALEPGNRKSAVVTECTAPLMAWQREQAERLAPEIRDALSRRKSAEAFIGSLRGKLGSGKADDEREGLISEIARLEAELPEVPRAPQLWTSDITPEKLGIVMAEQGERMALLSSEGGIFDTVAGRYSGVANLDLFLKAHAGDPERVDRGSREPVILDRPALTLGLSPQPSVLRAIASLPGFRGRGLLARFLYALPRSLVGERSGDAPPVTDVARSEYRDGIRALLGQSFESGEEVLLLSPEALGVWQEMSRGVEPRLREGADLHSIRDWAGKLPGAAARIAGLLHLAENAHGQPAKVPISPETMHQALKIAKVLMAHALVVFGFMGADADIEAAKVVLVWIRRKGLLEFSQSVLHNGVQSRFPRVEGLKRAIGVLQERNYLRELPQEKAAHRPAIRFQVNPSVLKVRQ